MDNLTKDLSVSSILTGLQWIGFTYLKENNEEGIREYSRISLSRQPSISNIYLEHGALNVGTLGKIPFLSQISLHVEPDIWSLECIFKLISFPYLIILAPWRFEIKRFYCIPIFCPEKVLNIFILYGEISCPRVVWHQIWSTTHITMTQISMTKSSKENLDKLESYKESRLYIKLQTFTWYDSKIDIHTFTDMFKKLHSDSEPKSLQPEFLKNNYIW